MASPLSAALSSLTAPGGSTSLPVSPEMVKSLLQGQPAFTVNRERAAAVLDAGFKTYDTYARLRPAIFVSGLVGMGISGLMLYKRRERGGETWIVWAAMFAASTGAAWIARPQPSVVPAQSTLAGQTTFGILSAIDARRAKLKAADPNFADKVFQRFDALPVVKAQLDTNPLLKAAL